MFSTLSLRILMVALLSTILLSFTGNSLAGQDNEKIVMETYTSLNYSPNLKSIQLLVSGNRITMGEGWEIKEVEVGLYHLRYQKWKGAFWEVDLNAKSIVVVKKGNFDKRAEKKYSVSIEAEYDEKRIWKRPDSPFSMYVKKSRIIYEPGKQRLDVQIAGMSITTGDKWETVTAAPNIYHIRHVDWKGFFWEIDAGEQRANYISSGKFGSLGAPGSYMSLVKFVDSGSSATGKVKKAGVKPPKPELPNDLGFKSSAATRVSEWTRSEKGLYESMLNSTYDVLVVPFQVQEYAFDRANRSLMTRYLANVIESRTDLKLPDPTIIDKALGEGVRRVSNDDVYRIANRLKVKMVIRGYVGHMLDEKMSLTLLIQSRDSGGNLGFMTKVTRLDWHDIPFSDYRPPAEVFRERLKEVVAKLPVQLTSNQKPVYFERSRFQVPDGIAPMLEGNSSAIRDAYNLQLLGMLYPVDSGVDTSRLYVDDYYEREPLFERSLVALEGVSPDSPDYRLLRARAWFYLQSRPAALKVLGTPVTPKEKAFLGYLNGNILEMEKWVGKIKSPIDKLIAQIELNDIKLDYSIDLFDAGYIKELIQSHRGIGLLLARRLTGKIDSVIIPSANIKALLDEAFPIKGYDVENMLRSKGITQGIPRDDYEVDLSIYKHRRRVQESKTDKITGKNGATRPVAIDHLELLYHTGESNLWKKVRYLTFTQGAYDSALELLKSYDEVYRGHLKHMYLTFKVKSGLIGLDRRLRSEVVDLAEKLCYYAQGQLQIAGCRYEKYYKHDYPRHWAALKQYNGQVLRSYRSMGVRREDSGGKTWQLRDMEYDLLYSHNKLANLTQYYFDLKKDGLQKEADKLLKQTESRFVGNPKKVDFLATVASRKDDRAKVVSIYRQAIARTPGVWSYYNGLGKYYLKMGEYIQARSVFENYPLFMNNGSGNREYSNRAFLTGWAFLSRGLITEGKLFLKKSAENSAGTYAEERSRALLALLELDLHKAEASFFNSYNNYNDNNAFDYSMSILHLAGKHEEARDIYNSVNSSNYRYQVPIHALIGFRMEGVNEGEQIRRLNEDRFEKFYPHAFYNFTVMSMMDRAPDSATYVRLRNLRGAANSSVSFVKTFGEGYYFIRQGNNQQAFSVLKKFKDKYIRLISDLSYRFHSTIIPYYAYAAAKTGNGSEALEYLEEVRERYGEDYQYLLAMSFIYGLDNRHEEALKSLTSAKNAMTDLVTLPLPQWYKLVEA